MKSRVPAVKPWAAGCGGTPLADRARSSLGAAQAIGQKLGTPDLVAHADSAFSTASALLSSPPPLS
jgi:hypothetical protein